MILDIIHKLYLLRSISKTALRCFNTLQEKKKKKKENQNATHKKTNPY